MCFIWKPIIQTSSFHFTFFLKVWKLYNDISLIVSILKWTLTYVCMYVRFIIFERFVSRGPVKYNSPVSHFLPDFFSLVTQTFSLIHFCHKFPPVRIVDTGYVDYLGSSISDYSLITSFAIVATGSVLLFTTLTFHSCIGLHVLSSMLSFFP